MMHRVLPPSLVIALALLCAPAVHALESTPLKTPHAEVTLVSETDAVEPGKPFRLGLRFKLAKGWHIYWLNPGDAGEPPHLDLTLPQGASAGELVFPTPLRIPEGPVMTYSYLGEVLFPVTVKPASEVAAFPLKAKASWLICEKICVPEEGTLSLDLPAGSAAPSAQARLFTDADQRIPHPSPFAASLSADATLSLAGDAISPSFAAEAWFFPDTWGAIDDAAPQQLSIGDHRLSLALKPAQTFDPRAGLSGILVIKDASGAESFYQVAARPDAAAAAMPPSPGSAVSAPAKPGTAAAAPAPADIGIAAMLLFAFLGGLILNLMPCVFPILAIKALTLAKLSAQERGGVRAHGASYTLGVLVAFIGLGALLIGFREAGSVAGWGFQFQSPAFVAGMAWLFLVLGLSLSGVFEVGLGLTGVGGGLAARAGHFGSFFIGFLAVLAATPCTAPFMGAAIAAAVTEPAPVTLAVFAMLGLGLAAPYALLALAPGLARLLPRPGAWMAVLKQALAFPLYGAAAWLVWVISQQTGPDGVLATAAGMVLLGFAAWVYGATQARERPMRPLGQAIAAAAAIASLFILRGVAAAPFSAPPSIAATDEIAPYSAERLAALRAEGRPVFVNMTAAWCVTCLVNERIALSSDTVRQAFAERKVAYLKGDWTRADPAISDFLRQHGRDGVPLYVFYPANGGDPVVLPQILTASAVLEELGRAGS